LGAGKPSLADIFKDTSVPAEYVLEGDTVSRTTVWRAIQAEVVSSFRYNLANAAVPDLRLSPIPTLRTLCQMVGITIAHRKYDFSSSTPFTEDDVIELFPVIKTSRAFDIVVRICMPRWHTCLC